jgi:hypothetical protein
MPTLAVVRVDEEELRRVRTGRFISRDELADTTGLHRDHIGRLKRNQVGDSHIPPSASSPRRSE